MIDIYDSALTGDLLNEMLSKPIEACRYCSEKLEFFDWEQAKGEQAKLEDWRIR